MEMPNVSKDWFVEWFDSPYYHILYNSHGTTEAENFINKLVKFLPITPENNVLDLACGKGRHSVYLNKLGMKVTGVDLSPNSIEFAKQFENDRLHFNVHDMREKLESENYDIILNLFTSFGYFEGDDDNKISISAIAEGLKPGGRFVIDFFNTNRVLKKLIPRYTLKIQGISFNISKKYYQGYIYKDIRFHDDGKDFHFHEKVKALNREDFAKYFKAAGLKIISLLGNYNLDQFILEKSDRMIFITEKI